MILLGVDGLAIPGLDKVRACRCVEWALRCRLRIQDEFEEGTLQGTRNNKHAHTVQKLLDAPNSSGRLGRVKTSAHQPYLSMMVYLWRYYFF